MNARGETVVLLASRGLDMGYMRAPLQSVFDQAGLPLELRQLAPTPTLAGVAGGEEVDVALCWEPPLGLWPQLPRVRLAQSVGAGVDHLLEDATLPPDLTLGRIRDPHMASGMTAYVVGAVTAGHRQRAAYARQQAQRHWQELPVVPATHYTVGIAGMGTLGTRCAQVLAAIGYQVRGWSRSAAATPLPGCTHHAGEAGREAFLDRLDALVCLLPLTAQTEGFVNAQSLAALAPGAHVINVGRGLHVVEADLQAALASGQVGLATLDSFVQEPLPQDHPWWRTPGVEITPHIATRTSPAVIAAQTLRHWLQVQAGQPLDAAVDRTQGY